MRIAVSYSILRIKNTGYDFSALMWPVPNAIMMRFVDSSDSRTTQSLPHHGESVTGELVSMGSINHVWWWNVDSRRAKGWSVHQGRWGRTNVLRTIAKASSIVDHPAQHSLHIHRWCCLCTWEFAKRELSGNKSLGPKKGNEVICWNVQFVRTKTIWGIFLPNSYL